MHRWIKQWVLVGAIGSISFLTPGVSIAQCVAALLGSGKLISISAPSGGGKTTLTQMLVNEFPDFELVVSTTTRPPRGTEKNGVDYHFVSVQEFQKGIHDGQFVEWSEVHGNFYGADKDLIRQALDAGKTIVILPDVTGSEMLAKAFPHEIRTIFLAPPDLQTLEKRLRGRKTDSESQILLRLSNAKAELANAHKFNKVIVNDDLQRAYAELKNYVLSEGPAKTP